MKINALIIDDEKMARTLLEGLIDEYCPNVAILGSYADLPSGVKAIKKLKPDLIFLDIEMPRHSGLELLDFFENEEIDFSIIFTTAYNQYAIQAFKLAAFDYLLKPIEPLELEKSITRFQTENAKKDFSVLKSNLKGMQPLKLAIPSVNSIKFVEINDILFLRGEGAYTIITLANHTYTASRNLKYFEDVFKENQLFFRCHKSYIVNLLHVTEHIKSYGGSLIIANEHEISLSSDRVQELGKLMREM
jgi:two-component system LytT family response regulator